MVAVSKFGRCGQGGSSVKPLLGDLVWRDRFGRGGKAGRPSPFEGLCASRGRGRRGRSPRMPSLGSFIGVAPGSCPVRLFTAFLSGL